MLCCRKAALHVTTSTYFCIYSPKCHSFCLRAQTFLCFVLTREARHLHKTHSTLLFYLLIHTSHQGSPKHKEGLVGSVLRTGAWPAQSESGHATIVQSLEYQSTGLRFQVLFTGKRGLRELQTATSLGLLAVNSDICSSIRNLCLWARRLPWGEWGDKMQYGLYPLCSPPLLCLTWLPDRNY